MKYPELTVGAVIFNNKNHILLCKSHKWDNKYVIPGGHGEYGEKLEEALKREVLEETALEIYDIKLLGIKECFYSNNHYHKRHFLFIDYRCRTDRAEVVLNEEHQEFIWISLDNLKSIELGGFTESLLLNIKKPDESEHKEEVFYNY